MTGAAIPLALTYTRVSGDDQEREGLSLDAQLASCRRYAAGKGWRLGSEYQDVMTGKRDDRPQYQALLAEVRRLRAEGQPVAVVLAALDRFGRRLLERVRCREELKALGVPVHSIREGGEVSDLVANILAAVAEEESGRIGVRVREVHAHLIDRGWLPVRQAAWGYAWRPATADERREGAPRSVPEVDPDTAPFVQQMFARALAGASSRALAAWAATLPSSARGGRTLSPAAVRYLLRAPIYAARPEAPADVPALERPVGRWPALVSDDDWAAVQAHLERHHRLPRQATGRYLLTGFLRCPRCGARMIGAWNRQRAPRYVCNARAYGSRAHDPTCQAAADAGQLERLVLTEAVALLDRVTAVERSLGPRLERAWERLRAPDRPAPAARARQQLERQRERAAKLLDASTGIES